MTIDGWISHLIEVWTRLTVRFFISLVWAVAALPLVTALPATVAAAISLRRVEDGYRATLSAFVYCFVQNLAQKILVGLPLWLSLLVSGLDFFVVLHIGVAWVVIVYVGIAALLNLYLAAVTILVAALLTTGKWSQRTVWKTANTLFWAQPGETLLFIGLITAVLLLGLRLAVPVILLSGLIAAAAVNRLSSRIYPQPPHSTNETRSVMMRDEKVHW